MRARPRHLLALLIIPAAVFFAGTPAHAAAASAGSSAIKVASSDCPAGTNWDDGLQECV
jgi:hypothetical protein